MPVLLGTRMLSRIIEINHGCIYFGINYLTFLKIIHVFEEEVDKVGCVAIWRVVIGEQVVINIGVGKDISHWRTA